MQLRGQNFGLGTPKEEAAKKKKLKAVEEKLSVDAFSPGNGGKGGKGGPAATPPTVGPLQGKPSQSMLNPSYWPNAQQSVSQNGTTQPKTFYPQGPQIQPQARKREDYPYCPCCKATSHSKVEQCQSFLQLNDEARGSFVKELLGCFKCFSRTHFSRECKVAIPCKTCGGPHNYLVCAFVTKIQEGRRTAKAAAMAAGAAASASPLLPSAPPIPPA